MDTAQRNALMRKIEKAVPPELNQIVSLQKKETLSNGSVINHYQVLDGKRPPGYLWINYDPTTMEIFAAEMDVDFDCLIGFNRSPIELRLLSRHVLYYLP